MDRIIELKSVYISMMGISLGVPYSLDNLLSKSVSSRQINFLKRNGYRYYLAADQSIRCMIDDGLARLVLFRIVGLEWVRPRRAGMTASMPRCARHARKPSRS